MQSPLSLSRSSLAAIFSAALLASLAASSAACSSSGADGGDDPSGAGGTGGSSGTSGGSSGNPGSASSSSGGDPSKSTPSLKVAVVGSSAIVVAPGFTSRIDVHVTRTGPARPVTLHVTGLGAGFTAPDVTVPAGADAASLVLTSTADAPSQPDAATLEASDGTSKASASITVSAARATIDTSFGGGGTIGMGGSIEDAEALPDGRFVISRVVVASQVIYSVRMFKGDGSPDPAFGTGGEATITPPTGASIDTGGHLAVQPDGRILFGAQLRSVGGGASVQSFGVVRLLSSGAVDTSFGAQGWATMSFAGIYSGRVGGLAVEPDGGVLVAGTLNLDSSGTFPKKRKAGLARFTSGGQPDAAFGTGGAVTTAWGGTYGNALGIRRIGAGTYVMGYGDAKAQYDRYDGQIARITANGSLDATFGTGGTVKVGTGVLDLLIPPSGPAAGELLIAMDSGNFSGAVALIDPATGEADKRGAPAGYLTDSQGGSTSYTNDALPALDGNGNIVVLKGAIDDKRMEVLAYSPLGAPLTTYAGTGKIAFKSTGGYVNPVRIVPLANGRMLVAAWCDDYSSAIGAFFP